MRKTCVEGYWHEESSVSNYVGIASTSSEGK